MAGCGPRLVPCRSRSEVFVQQLVSVDSGAAAQGALGLSLLVDLQPIAIQSAAGPQTEQLVAAGAGSSDGCLCRGGVLPRLHACLSLASQATGGQMGFCVSLAGCLRIEPRNKRHSVVAVSRELSLSLRLSSPQVFLFCVGVGGRYE